MKFLVAILSFLAASDAIFFRFLFGKSEDNLSKVTFRPPTVPTSIISRRLPVNVHKLPYYAKPGIQHHHQVPLKPQPGAQHHHDQVQPQVSVHVHHHHHEHEPDQTTAHLPAPIYGHAPSTTTTAPISAAPSTKNQTTGWVVGTMLIENLMSNV